MELELKDFDLPTALDSALALVRERAGRRAIALHLSVDERLGQVQADEQKIRQVVLNLLSNAIKFTPEGGRIEVTAVAKDGLVEVSVSDTGVGIAPEDQEAVFEEFRQVGTADKKVEGGLGLALSRKFVELHGGRIWAKEPTRVNTIVPGWIDTPMTEVALHGEAFMGKVLPRVPMRRWAWATTSAASPSTSRAMRASICVIPAGRSPWRRVVSSTIFFRRRRPQAEFGAFCPDLAGAGPGMLLAARVEP